MPQQKKKAIQQNTLKKNAPPEGGQADLCVRDPLSPSDTAGEASREGRLVLTYRMICVFKKLKRPKNRPEAIIFDENEFIRRRKT